MSDTRAFEMTLEITVQPDAVWQALTDAEELVRWFPLNADVTPGPGGKWLVSWNGQWPWNTEIAIWEPKRHLRLIDRSARPYDAEGRQVIESAAPMPIAIDWYLEGKGGSTTLRLVHSGFGRGGAWDDEFDGVSVGWQLELRGLKHYLEHHRGRDRRLAWNRTVVAVPLQVLWPRLTGREGILLDANLMSLPPGARYGARLSTGDRIEGTVLVTFPNRGFQVTVDGWNNALYRLWLDRVGDQSAVNSWLTTYDMPAEFVRDFDARMKREIDRLGVAAVA